MLHAVRYRMLEPMGGVVAHIRRQRLGWAASRFATQGGNKKMVAQVAQQLNFSSIPAFACAYRAQHGHSPTDLRRKPSRGG